MGISINMCQRLKFWFDDVKYWVYLVLVFAAMCWWNERYQVPQEQQRLQRLQQRQQEEQQQYDTDTLPRGFRAT